MTDSLGEDPGVKKLDQFSRKLVLHSLCAWILNVIGAMKTYLSEIITKSHKVDPPYCFYGSL